MKKLSLTPTTDHTLKFNPNLFSLTIKIKMPPQPKSTSRSLQIHSSAAFRHSNNNQKVIIIMGPTGAGKSRLSIDLATRVCTRPEIINSDKIQVYRDLDITTNKITMLERVGVPHHLLGVLDPTGPEFTPSDFRFVGSSTISCIASRSGLPLVVGGSNSFVYALLAKRFDPGADIFNGSDPVCVELRYNCCFLCLDVSSPILNKYLCKRVDEMLDSGMLNELSEFYGSDEFDSVNSNGLKKAIGVPEFEKYFKRFGWCTDIVTNPKDDVTRKVMYEEAVRDIKENTCQLAKRQVEKIQRLREAGWDILKIDATEVFKAAVGSDSGGVSTIWEKQVVEPSMKIVKGFLEESSNASNGWEAKSCHEEYGAAKSENDSVKGRTMLDR